MAKFTLYLVITLLTIVIPYLGVLNISKVEEDSKYKPLLEPTTKDKIIVLIAGIASACAVVYQDSRMRMWAGLPETYYISFMIGTATLLGYLIFMSYTDQKIKLLYTAASLITMIVEIIIFAINWDVIKTCFINEYTWTVLPVIIVLAIMSIFRYIGFGDVIIYAVLGIYLVSYRTVPLVSILINIVIANTLFIINALISKAVRKDKTKHQPLTMFIALATFLCGGMLI
jgi:hypothetical protein